MYVTCDVLDIFSYFTLELGNLFCLKINMGACLKTLAHTHPSTPARNVKEKIASRSGMGKGA